MFICLCILFFPDQCGVASIPVLSSIVPSKTIFKHYCFGEYFLLIVTVWGDYLSPVAENDNNLSWKLSFVLLNGVNYVLWSRAPTLSFGGKKN